jgi:hypothetical protein
LRLDQELKVSKLDAARRQLETVVRLYFHDGDPVSIHTLTAAGYNVLRDVNAKRGGAPMMVKDQLKQYVKPEMQKEFHDLLHAAENFFKHADRDHDAVLDFMPKQSELMIYDACSKYYELTGEQPPLFQVYRAWFMVTHRELFSHVPAEWKIKLDSAAQYVHEGRMSHFNTMLPLVMGSGITR